MSSSIRLPEGLPVPERDSFQSQFESSVQKIAMDVGAPRQRRNRTTAPELMTCTMDLSLVQYQEFDYWYQNTIKAGAAEFDMQLLDNDTTLVWYTVRMIGQYKYEVIGQFLDQWRITMTVRTLKPSFTDRPSGTDELRGGLSIEMTMLGQLSVPYIMRGVMQLDMTTQARLGQGKMYGSITVDMLLTARISTASTEVSYELREDGGRQLREDGSNELRD